MFGLSGINPKKLISKPNNIIPTTKSATDAMNNLIEIPHRQLDPSAFQEQNDFERQIQGLTFTIDTNNSNNTQGLTNTATGMRIKFFESNVVIDEIRKHFEAWMERLAYKVLAEIAENLWENMTIKQMWDDGFWEINKEAIMDAVNKYEIRIETWSSSYDTIEERRNDAIAKFNIWLQAKQAGVNADIDEITKDVFNTFEWVSWDKYIKPAQPMPWMPWVPWGWAMQVPMSEPGNTPAATVEAVAWGWVTAWL